MVLDDRHALAWIERSSFYKPRPLIHRISFKFNKYSAEKRILQEKHIDKEIIAGCSGINIPYFLKIQHLN